MDNGKKKMVMIVVTIVCILIAVGSVVMTSMKDDMPNSNKKTTLMCKSLDCKAVYEITTKELNALLPANDPSKGLIMNPDMEYMTIKCKECGEKSAQIAEKCKKCGYLFILNYDATDDYLDRCPDCGYSKLAER